MSIGTVVTDPESALSFCRLCKNCRQPDVRGKGTEAGRKKIEKYIYNR